MKSLEERLNSYEGEVPTTWKAKVGDQLTGEFQGYEEVDGSYGPATVARVQDDDGRPWGVWLTPVVLRGEFDRKKPQPGARIGLKRLPDGHSQSGDRAYKRYVLLVDGQDEIDSDQGAGLHAAAAKAVGLVDASAERLDQFNDTLATQDAADDGLPF